MLANAAPLLVRALRREPVERTPVWMMRQAGRCLPEYRALRERHGFTTLLTTPELAAEVTLQPVERLGVDAAILFADILSLAVALGVTVEFRPGPVVMEPIRSEADLHRLDPKRAAAGAGFVTETVALVAAQLRGSGVATIGFAGAPFTLGAYLVEAGPQGHSRDFEAYRALAHGQPRFFSALLDRLAQATVPYLVAQARAGAQALQLFDTWAGLLDAATYQRLARPVLDGLCAEVRRGAPGIPLIYFAPHAPHLWPALAGLDVDAFSADWRLPLSAVRSLAGPRYALQGNLDPAVLLAGEPAIDAGVARILADWGEADGHVMNLGHGVLPSTPVEAAGRFVAATRELSQRPAVSAAGARA